MCERGPVRSRTCPITLSRDFYSFGTPALCSTIMVPYLPSVGTMTIVSVRSVASEDFQRLWILSPQVRLVKVDSLMSIQGYRPVNEKLRDTNTVGYGY